MILARGQVMIVGSGHDHGVGWVMIMVWGQVMIVNRHAVQATWEEIHDHDLTPPAPGSRIMT